MEEREMMHLKKILVLSAALAFIAGSEPAAAQQPSAGGIRSEARFNAMDTDRDGRISRSEFVSAAQARAEKAFARADADGDGYLSKEEFQNSRGKRARSRRSDPLPQ